MIRYGFTLPGFLTYALHAGLTQCMTIILQLTAFTKSYLLTMASYLVVPSSYSYVTDVNTYGHGMLS
jgi:hypothetical protein